MGINPSPDNAVEERPFEGRAKRQNAFRRYESPGLPPHYRLLPNRI